MPRLTDFETSLNADTSTFSKGGGTLAFVAPELRALDAVDDTAKPTRQTLSPFCASAAILVSRR